MDTEGYELKAKFRSKSDALYYAKQFKLKGKIIRKREKHWRRWGKHFYTNYHLYVQVAKTTGHIHGCGHPVRPVVMCDDPFCLIESGWVDWHDEHNEAEEGKCICFFCWKEQENN